MNLNAILLCAGFGTRLGSLTRETAKPLLPVAGKPIVDYLVEQLAATDRVKELTVVSNHRFAAQFDRWRAGVSRRLPGLGITVVDDGATTNEHRLGAVRDLAWAVGTAKIESPALGKGTIGAEFARSQPTHDQRRNQFSGAQNRPPRRQQKIGNV